MYLTRHFKLIEFVSSDEGLSDIQRDDILLRNLKKLAEFLERVRSRIGVPIIITSGYRTQRENVIVGGVRYSYHLQGLAADIKIQTGLRLPLILSVLSLREHGGVGIYSDKNAIHVDIGPKRYWGDTKRYDSFIPTFIKIIQQEIHHLCL